MRLRYQRPQFLLLLRTILPLKSQDRPEQQELKNSTLPKQQPGVLTLPTTLPATCSLNPTGSLTILEGTTVIVDGAYSFTVRGNFYTYGTATDSVVFTVPAVQRKQANIFAGLWGGVLSSNTDGTNVFAANEMVVQYTRMEYTGMLGQAWQDIVKLGEIADTNTPEYALFFNNPTGVCVIQNSTFAYSADVAVQVDQGKVLISNNAFILNGKAGGEAIDTKVDTYGDIAYNLFYKTATNGVKFNAKGGSAAASYLQQHGC